MRTRRKIRGKKTTADPEKMIAVTTTAVHVIHNRGETARDAMTAIVEDVIVMTVADAENETVVTEADAMVATAMTVRATEVTGVTGVTG